MASSKMAPSKPVISSKQPGKSGPGGPSEFIVIFSTLGLLVLLAYLPAAWNDFVDYDDSDYVTANARVQSGLTWANLAWAFTTGHASNWHPLTWLSHMLDWRLFGAWAGGHHLVSVGLHLVNTLLLFLVLRRATGQMWRSALVAALFGLHPLHVESVAWVAERKDVLSTLFFILALGAYVMYSEAHELSSAPQTPGHNPRMWQWHGATLLLFALGLMSKPMLVTFPFILLLLDYWPLKRVGFAETGTDRNTMLRGASLLILEKFPFFVLSIGSSIVTFVVQRYGGSVSAALSLDERIANALVAYSRYLAKTFYPAELSVLYPHPGHWPAWRVVLGAVLMIGITALVVWRGRRRPYAIVGWLWFVGTLVPVIGVVQVGLQSMADRYTYIPLIGLFIMLVWISGDLVQARSSLARPAYGVCFLVVAGCFWLTLNQVRLWRNSGALFEYAVRVTEGNYLAYNNLGYYYSRIGQADKALEHYQKSLQIRPDYEEALNNMGHALAARKRFHEALPFYHAALARGSNRPEVLNNLGNALSELGRLDEAIGYYRKALAADPDNADAHNNLGVALAMRGNFNEAIHELRQVIRLRPAYASAYSNLGNVYAMRGMGDEAISQYRQALRLNPRDAQTHNNLGNALAQKGRGDEAVEHYREALRLNADNPEAHYNLSRVLAAQGKVQEAMAHVREALRLRPDYAEARSQLEALNSKPPAR
jgi:tetratricopeptide (TPR) repeat protein